MCSRCCRTAIRAAREYEGIFSASASYAYEECFSHPISYLNSVDFLKIVRAHRNRRALHLEAHRL